MGYHYGRYAPPPAAPVLPPHAVAAIPLPAASEHPSLRLPPPPSAAARAAELPISRELAAIRTPAGDAWALHLDARGATSDWWGAAQEVTRTRGVLRGLELRAALVAGQLGGLVATYAPGQAKYPKQLRPFQLDHSVSLLGHLPGTSSYPSGHARQAFASARIVSRLDPAQAEGAMAFAGDVARSRVYAGAHLPSDVAAGARLGIAVGDAVVGAVHVARVAVPIAAVAGGAWALHEALTD